MADSTYNSAFQLSPAPQIITTVAEGRIIDVNEACCEILGYGRHELIGTTLAENKLWKFPEQRPLLLAQMDAAGAVNGIELIISTRTGAQRTLQMSAKPITWNGVPCAIASVQDITDQKAREAKTRQWADAFEHCAHGIAIGRSATNEILTCNPAFARTQGYTVEELEGMPIPQLYAPDVRPQVKAIISAAEHSGSIHYETMLVRKDGSTYPAQMDLVSIKDERGTPLYRVATQEDITERRQAEKALRQSEQRYRRALDNMLEGVQILGHDWRYLYLNASAEIHNRRPNSELLGNCYADMWPGIDKTLVFAAIKQSLDARTVNSLENEFIYPDGQVRWFELSIQPIEEGVLILSFDITDRKQAERALRLSEERHRQISGLISDYVYSGVMSSDRTVTTEWVSGAFDRITGYTADEVNHLPGGFADLLLPNELDRMLGQLAAQSGADAQTLEYRIRRQDGEIRWLRDYMQFLPSTSAGRKMIGAVQDITAQKVAQNDLQESEERFRSLFESSDAIMLLIDPDSGSILDANPAAARFYGYSRSQLTQINIAAINQMPPEQATAERQKAKTRTQNYFTFPHRLANGDIRMVEVRTSPIKLQDQTVLFSIISDITERRRSEAIVLAQRDLARAIGEVASSREAWAICLDIALRISGMDSGGIYLFSQDGAVLEIVHHVGLQPAFVQAVSHFAVDSPNAQLTLRGETACFTGEQVSQIPMYREEGLQALIGAPIRYQGRVIGSLNVASHTLAEVSEPAMAAIEAITPEIGNFAVYVRADAALRASEEKYRSLVEASDALIVLLDREGRFRYLNEKAADYLSIPLDGSIGKSVHELLPQSTADRYLEYTGQILTSRHGVVVESPAGSKWYRTSVQPVRDDTGEPAMVLMSATDITEQKNTQQQLLELNRTLEQRVAQRTAEVQDLYEHAPAGYHSLDVNGCFIRINQTELEWFGYAREEMIGRPMQDFLTPQSRATFRAHFPQFRIRGFVHDLEFDCIRKDGSVFPVLVSATLISDEAGNYVMSRSTMLDISERKRAEDALQLANAEMERAMRLKDEFLANMSHELRTPLNTILTLAEVMSEQVYGPLNERQLRSLQYLDSSGRHLLALINDLLDLSKIEAGKLDLDIQPVAVDEVCQASLMFVREVAHKKGLTINYYNARTYARIAADPRRLKQMLVNLLSNAVKFTPEGGEINLDISVNQEDHVIEFAVRDTGPGIAAKDLPKLFQPFSQLDSALTRQFEGTGLGLALVKRLAAQHGGSVRVQSTGIPGQGACFTIALPYALLDVDVLSPDESTRRATLETPFAAATAAPDILLVDDNTLNVETIAAYLRHIGYDVRVAANGDDALEMAFKAPPDLILMDIQLPQMDGMEVIRRLRVDLRLAATPIIAITAFAMNGDRERCLKAGASEYMSKPLRMIELSAMMKKLLDERAQPGHYDRRM